MDALHPTVIDRLHMREYARAIGDMGLEASCNADLVRYGYRDEPGEPMAGPETAVPVEALERAVPDPPRRGRKPLPRCEHGQIVGRCAACDDEEEHETDV